jgi:hypothetical protein
MIVPHAARGNASRDAPRRRNDNVEVADVSGVEVSKFLPSLQTFRTAALASRHFNITISPLAFPPWIAFDKACFNVRFLSVLQREYGEHGFTCGTVAFRLGLHASLKARQVNQLPTAGRGRMRDAVALISAGIVVAMAAWAFWYHFGTNASPMLSAVMIVALAVDNMRLRHEVKKLKRPIKNAR